MVEKSQRMFSREAFHMSKFFRYVKVPFSRIEAKLQSQFTYIRFNAMPDLGIPTCNIHKYVSYIGRKCLKY